MKRIMFMAIAGLLLTLTVAGSAVFAQEVEIPVIYDRSYLLGPPIPHTDPQYLEYESLMSADFFKKQIVLSPDEEWIAYLPAHNMPTDIWIVPSVGGEPQKIYTIPAEQRYYYLDESDYSYNTMFYGDIVFLAYSPDGQEITFVRNYYDPSKGGVFTSEDPELIPTIESVNIQTGEVRTIIAEGTDPKWSMDGRYLSYVHFDHMALLDPEQAHHHMVPAIYDTETGETEFMFDVSTMLTYPDLPGGYCNGSVYSEMVLLPDNSKLVGERSDIDAESQSIEHYLIMMDRETGDERILSDDVNSISFISVTNDGRYVVYTDHATSPSQKVYLCDLNTGDSIGALYDYPVEHLCGVVTQDMNSIYYLSMYDWGVHDDYSNISIDNASKVCRQPIDIAMRFTVGDGSEQPELPDDYGLLPEYGTRLSNTEVKTFSMVPFAWSPDGIHIAFASDQGKIWSVNIDTGEQEEIFNNPPMTYNGYPVETETVDISGFTADGQEVLFSMPTVDEERGSVPELTIEGGQVVETRWSDCIRYLYAVDIETKAIRTVVVGGDRGACSPDGRYLAYTMFSYSRNTNDDFIEAHKNQTVIRDLETGTETFLDVMEYMQYHWSADSNALIMRSSAEGYIRVPIDGSEPTLLGPSGSMIYSVFPDESGVVFGQNDAIYSLDFQSGERTPVMNASAGIFSYPMLSRDGSKLAYIVNYEGKSLYDPYSTFYRSNIFVKDFDGFKLAPTLVEDSVPTTELMVANYPNPFNPSTTISFTLPSDGFTTLAIYNLSGQRVCELAQGDMQAGMHEIVWNGRSDDGVSVASGIYIARIATGNHVASQRMLLMK